MGHGKTHRTERAVAALREALCCVVDGRAEEHAGDEGVRCGGRSSAGVVKRTSKEKNRVAVVTLGRGFPSAASRSRAGGFLVLVWFGRVGVAKTVRSGKAGACSKSPSNVGSCGAAVSSWKKGRISRENERDGMRTTPGGLPLSRA